jgi:hypothetical protein
LVDLLLQLLELSGGVGDEILDSHEIFDVSWNSGDLSVQGIEFSSHLEVG